MKIIDGVNWEHYCEMPKFSEYEMAGHAIDYCKEYDDKKLFAGNGEYESQVNFCPLCGYEAKIKFNQNPNNTNVTNNTGESFQ